MPYNPALMRPVYVLSAARTPIGKFGGSFCTLSAADLGEVAARAAIERSGLPAAAVDETIFGHARQAGGGPNTARQVSHRAGVPDSVPAYTVNKACASGIKSIALGFQEIATGDLDCDGQTVTFTLTGTAEGKKVTTAWTKPTMLD